MDGLERSGARFEGVSYPGPVASWTRIGGLNLERGAPGTSKGTQTWLPWPRCRWMGMGQLAETRNEETLIWEGMAPCVLRRVPAQHPCAPDSGA